MRGDKVQPLKSKSSLEIAIRAEMKSYLKAFILDNQNISTFAAEDLLMSNLRLETFSRIKFCKVKRAKVHKNSAESMAQSKSGLKKLEREFKRQYKM